MKSNIIKFLIIIVITVLVVIVGIEVLNNNKPEPQDKPNNEAVENTDKDNNTNTIKDKLVETSLYYWQNPSQELEEYIMMGMQGGMIKFEEDGTVQIDGGNGNWHEGKYRVEDNIVICTIDTHNSEWHKKEEKLENTVEFKLKYTENDDSLEVINISKPTLTIHTIDMITGELTEETKEYWLEQLTVGNIYSSENKYGE